MCFPSTIPVVTRCSVLSFLVSWPKKSDRIVSASRNTVLLDFFVVHEIHSFASSFFICLEIVQTLRPYIRIGSIQHFRALLVWMKMYLFVSAHFILLLTSATLDKISVLLRPSLHIQIPKYLNGSLCLSLFPLIKMLICGHSLF